MSDEEKSNLKRYRAKRASTAEIGRALSKYAVPKTTDTGSAQTDACGSEEKRNQEGLKRLPMVVLGGHPE